LAAFELVIPDEYYMVGYFGQPNHDGAMDGVLPLLKPI